MKLSFWLIVLGTMITTGCLYYLVNEQVAVMFLLLMSLMGNVGGYLYMAKNVPLFARDRHLNRFTIKWPDSWHSNRR